MSAPGLDQTNRHDCELAFLALEVPIYDVTSSAKMLNFIVEKAFRDECEGSVILDALDVEVVTHALYIVLTQARALEAQWTRDFNAALGAVPGHGG